MASGPYQLPEDFRPSRRLFIPDASDPRREAISPGYRRDRIDGAFNRYIAALFREADVTALLWHRRNHLAAQNVYVHHLEFIAEWDTGAVERLTALAADYALAPQDDPSPHPDFTVLTWIYPGIPREEKTDLGTSVYFGRSPLTRSIMARGEVGLVDTALLLAMLKPRALPDYLHRNFETRDLQALAEEGFPLGLEDAIAAAIAAADAIEPD